MQEFWIVVLRLGFGIVFFLDLGHGWDMGQMITNSFSGV